MFYPGWLLLYLLERWHSLLLSLVGFSLAILIKTHFLQEHRVIRTLAQSECVSAMYSALSHVRYLYDLQEL
jgi:hypothetical protein